MRYLILSLAVMAAACNPVREKANTTNYDVISEKCFVLREHPVKTDSLVNANRDSLVQFLKAQQYEVRFIRKDSLLFRKENGQEVEIVLPSPKDAWESNTIIVFDPAKSPFFVNLRKGTGQVQQYLKNNQ